MFITESWFWRGTQSAIFYYVSCSPLQEYKHKKQRRKEAARSEKEKAEIITQQPGLIVQPGPFQTNTQWAEEIMLGPGPPKRWKKNHEKLLKGILKGTTEDERVQMRERTEMSQQEIYKPVPTFPYTTPTVVEDRTNATTTHAARGLPAIAISTSSTGSSSNAATGLNSPMAEPMSPISEVTSVATDTSSSPEEQAIGHARPSVDRRLSSAVENIKDTIKNWNWKRYEREDEVLSGFQGRLRGMWDRATNHGVDGAGEPKKSGRKRAATNDSERYDWERVVRNPEINEMHPPTVSKLPATREEAAWMLLPPPSRAVMEGKKKPQDETMQRWPLAVIGRNADEWALLEKARNMKEENQSVMKEPTKKLSLGSVDSNSGASWRTPDLSNSSSDDEHWSDDEVKATPRADVRKHQVPLGWTPMRPKAVAQPFQRAAQYWGSEATYRA